MHTSYDCIEKRNRVADQTAEWLDAYFSGAGIGDLPPLQPRGTPFQQLIWQCLLQIPYGQSVTYGQIAEIAAKRLHRNTMSAQAVGQAVAANPIGILIPCHRVLAAGNRIGGYAGGLERKKWLLRHEGIAYI